MNAIPRTPTTRILTLAVLFVAAGVFCLRAIDIFGAPNQPTAQAVMGNSLERELTYLIEPIVGKGNARVSVTGTNEKTLLILVNKTTSDATGALSELESIVRTAANFNPASDTISVKPIAFATASAPSLSTLSIVELSGLAFICFFLCAIVLVPEPEAQIGAHDKETVPKPAEPEPIRTAPAPIAQTNPAATHAINDPSGTVRVLRQWMNTPQEPTS